MTTKYDSLALDGYLNATTPPPAKGGPTMGGRVHCAVGTVETGATDAVGTIYTLARIPANARILGQSVLHYDALGTGAKLEVGLAAVNGNITGDVDCLMASTAVSTAGSTNLPGDIANYGSAAWDLAGETADPGGEVDVQAQVTVVLAAAGTVTLEIYFLLP